MKNNRNYIEKRIRFLEKVYLEDRERWKKNEELWEKNNERWTKSIKVFTKIFKHLDDMMEKLKSHDHAIKTLLRDLHRRMEGT